MARTAKAVNDAALQRWRRDLEPWELDLFEFVAARQLRQHGYALSRGRRPLPPPWPLLRFVKLNVLRGVAATRARYRDAVRQLRYRQAVAVAPPEPPVDVPAVAAGDAGAALTGDDRSARL